MTGIARRLDLDLADMYSIRESKMRNGKQNA
jgi:hypothetical protein